MAGHLRRQDDPSTTTATPSTLLTMTGTATNGMPSSSDSYSGNQNDNAMQSTSLVNYYFVFLALIVCVAGLSAFLLWRRRSRARVLARISREHALTRDLIPWQGNGRAPDGRVRGYWHGRWRSQEDMTREEGLNELGEAPPAYAPSKPTPSQQREGADGSPAVPMQTLSREDAGLKPPDYSEMTARATESPRRGSDAGGEGSSREAGRRPDLR